MTTVTLTPEQDRFATEAVAQGRFRDVNEVVGASLDLLRYAETERAAFLASLKEAEAESEQHGFLAADDVHREMGEFIEGMGQQQA
jgi:antitoxin ParD1/3/4